MNPVRMKSAIVKRSIVIHDHKTSVSLEDAFWTRLKDMAGTAGTTLSKYVEGIDAERTSGNLSSAVRIHVLERFARYVEQRQATDAAGKVPVTVIVAKTTPPANDFAQA